MIDDNWCSFCQVRTIYDDLIFAQVASIIAW